MPLKSPAYPQRPSRFHALAPVLVCAALAACGGGGGDSSSTQPDPVQTGNPPPPSTQVTATCDLPDFAASALARVNQWRASGANCGSSGNFGPAAALTWNDLLTQSSAVHSQDMVTHNFFSHTGSNGSTLAQRVNATGYAWSALGENIAAGQTTINGVVDGWIASPGHCANIMNPNFVHIGLACIRGTSANAYPTYWTMDLGRPL
jgi:uncharacterized protein YkwD